MALQVWLPLNGDTHNQGLCGDALSISNVSFTDGGKIGSKAMINGGIAMSAAVSKKILKNTFSYCFWYCPITTSGSTQLCGRESPRTMTMFSYSTPLGFHGDWRKEDGETIYTSWYWPSFFTLNEWTHVVVTYDGDTRQVYKNGQLYDSQYAGFQRTNLEYDWDIIICNNCYKINDVRLYDHCLSPKEVYEIAKGLVLHYPMNEYIKQPNLTSETNWSIYNNYGVSSSLTKTGEYFKGSPVYRLTQTPTSSNVDNFRWYLGNHGVYNNWTTFNANTKYCYWIYFKPVSHKDIRVGGTASNIGGWTEIPPEYIGNGWYRVGQYRNSPYTQSDGIYTSYYTPSAQAGVPISIDFACPYLIAGFDSIQEFYDYNTNNNIIHDCSGYQYNGTISGSLSCSNDSPRYRVCYNNDTTGGIYAPLNINLSAYTLSFWQYNTTSSGMPIGCNASKTNRSANFYWYGVNSWKCSAGELYYSGGATNVWQHCVAVYDGSQLRIYINGELSGTKSMTGVQNFGNFSVLDGYNGTGQYLFNGKISDVRLYTTALSADDIKELYNTSAYVANNGTLLTYNLEE